jgi:thiamine-phosphate pyrophosphorylase
MAITLDQRIKGLYGITPNKKLDIEFIENIIIAHQVKILQYRYKTQDDQLKLDEAQQLRELCLTHNTLFIVNDDINLCEKVYADGVHLGQLDKSISEARYKLGKQAIIGISCYNKIGLAVDSEKSGASYVAFGALFDSKTKPNAEHCKLSVIKSAKKRINIPIVGIGGITFENQNLAFNAGCDAVAMLNGLFS